MLLHLIQGAGRASADRADFLSRLFARPRPAGLAQDAPAPALFAAYASATRSKPMADAQLRAIFNQLTQVHGLALDRNDRAKIEDACALRRRTKSPRRLRPRDGNAAVDSFARGDVVANRPDGRNQSFLGSESNFATLKSYESRNLIVPIVGVAGTRAARRRRHLRRRGMTVGTFTRSVPVRERTIGRRDDPHVLHARERRHA
jgi:hypothetical protein